MTKKPQNPLLNTSELLELSMSIGQYTSFEENAKAFTSCFKKLLHFESCEIWLLKIPNSRSYYKAHKNSTDIIHSNIFETKSNLSIFDTDELFNTTVIKPNVPNSLDGFTNIKKGIIYTFKLCNQVLLIAYSPRFENLIAKENLSILTPFFNRFYVSLEQSHFTERYKHIEAGVLDSKEDLQRYKLVVDNVSEGLIIFNKDLEVVFVNERLSQLSEYKTEETIGKHIDKLNFDDRYIPLIKNMLKQVFSGKSISNTLEHQRKYSREKWWFEGTLSPYKNDQGKIVGAIAIIRDITIEKLAQEAAAESKSRYELLINHGFDGVLLYDLKHKKMLSVNDTLLKNFGYTKKEFLEIKVSEAAPSHQSNGLESCVFLNQVNETIQKKGKYNYEWIHKKKDGSLFYVEVVAVRLLPPNDHIKIEIHKDITKRFHTQKALRENENRLSKLFEMSPIPILIRSIKNKRFKQINQKFTELFGYTIEEINSIKRETMVYWEDTKYIKQNMEKLLTGEISSFKLEKQYIRKDGVIFWGLATRSLVEIDGELFIIGFIQDITERKKMTLALRESEAKLRSIFDSTNDKIIALDKDFRIIDYNKSGERFLSAFYKGQNLKLGDTFAPINPKTNKPWTSVYKKALHGEGSTHTREYFLDQEYVVDLINILPIKDELGKPIGISLYGKEITELKKIQQELTEFNEKYQDLFDNMYDASLVTNAEGYFINANKAAQELLEYSLEELKHLKILDIVHPDDLEKAKLYRKKLKLKGYYSNYEGRVYTKNRNIKFLQVNSNAIIKDTKIIGSRNIARDITELKNAEIRREQLFSELEYANKELKDFAYIVSHDLKAPLRAIAALSTWVKEDYQDLFDEQGKSHLELLIGRVNRMQNFIEGILEYSRLGRLKIKKSHVNIKNLLDTVLDSLAPPKHFSFEIDPDIPIIRCEKIRMHQVFQNLISNAIKYNDKPKGIVKIKYRDLGRVHEFSVEDNGPGIEERHFEKIFKIFQTLQSRDELESTGIGLTIVKRIVELHEGKIELSAILGQGSKFCFTIIK